MDIKRRSKKKTAKLRFTGLCAGNWPETGEFPAQMASYAENVPFDDVIMQHQLNMGNFNSEYWKRVQCYGVVLTLNVNKYGVYPPEATCTSSEKHPFVCRNECGCSCTFQIYLTLYTSLNVWYIDFISPYFWLELFDITISIWHGLCG